MKELEFNHLKNYDRIIFLKLSELGQRRKTLTTIPLGRAVKPGFLSNNSRDLMHLFSKTSIKLYHLVFHFKFFI